MPDGIGYSRASDVSADGTTVVGHSLLPTSRYEAYCYTDATGTVSLGYLPDGGFQSFARGVSADGTTVAGDGSSLNGREAFRYTDATGMQSVLNIFNGLRLSPQLAGWTLTGATGISDDGRTVVGSGTNPDGNQEAWIATIPNPIVPEPTSAALAMFSLALLGFRGKRRRQP